MKDGRVFGIPCYAVDEIYYTFTDASQLKEICAGGGFRLTEETAYYYNYTPSNKDILNTLSENDKITVIDHDGDNAFDVVLVTTSYPATVTSVLLSLTRAVSAKLTPLTVHCTAKLSFASSAASSLATCAG